MNSEIKKVLNKIEKSGFEAYIVGGFVRDYLLCHQSNDIDICTNALPKDIKTIFGNSKENGIYGSYNLKTKKNNYDITTYRKEFDFQGRNPSKIEYTNNLLEDLERRDFTINAICMNTKGKILDLKNGVQDLENKIIRSIKDPETSIKEDPLRILRAIRFACTLNFQIEETLWNAIKKNPILLDNLSSTRIKKELDAILISPNFQKGFQILSQLNLLEKLGLETQNINYVNDVNGMWAQIKVTKDYPFTKNEKDQINQIKLLIKKELTPEELFKHGLYPVLVAAKIQNIKEETITKMYKKMPIETRKDLKITFEEILKITQKEPKEVKQIEDRIITMILKRELKNKKDQIINQLKKEGA